MRRLLTFSCEGEMLAASLDDAGGTTGILLVIGGSQTRIGSHRMYERLAKALAGKGYPCFRFDRRGVGDSGGDDPGFRGSGPDIAAAATAFRAQCPALKRVVGFGLCDGATALALSGTRSRARRPDPGQSLAGRGGGGDAPAPRGNPPPLSRRLLSLEGWRRLFTGGVELAKALSSGVRKIATRPARGPARRRRGGGARRAAASRPG